MTDARRHLLFSPPRRGYWLLSHRGLTTEAPENTVEAFDAALEAGADGVELDLSRNREGRWVTRHADHLPGSGEEVAPAAEKGRTDPRPDRSLQTLFDWARRHRNALINIELKEPGGEDDLLEHCQEFKSQLLVTSFTADALWSLHELEPGLPTGLLAHYGSEINLKVARLLEADWLIWRDRYVTADLLQATRDAGSSSMVWEVTDLDRARELVGWGAAGLITDHIPDLAPVARRAR